MSRGRPMGAALRTGLLRYAMQHLPLRKEGRLQYAHAQRSSQSDKSTQITANTIIRREQIGQVVA